jgi:putative flippase GtrA
MKPLILQLMRFGITGGTAALTHFSIVFALVHSLHMPPLTANIYAFMVAFFISYSGHRYWTFANSSHSARSTLPRFFLISCLNFIGNQSLYYFLLTALHMNYLIALVIVLGIIASISFIINKFWVFG